MTSAPAAQVACERMTGVTRAAARDLLGTFLRDDPHYRASSAVYGDGGAVALERALDLFIARPELGFVWLAFTHGGPVGTAHAAAAAARSAVGACVVCFAISTSRGAIVAKLDDVSVRPGCEGRGIGTAMLASLFRALEESGVGRVDTACHRDNVRAWRFYERLGFAALHEERMARLLTPRAEEG